MTGHTILAGLMADGIILRLADDGENLVAPPHRLSSAQRAVVVANKQAILDCLRRQRDEFTQELWDEAFRICDMHGDGEAARDQMRWDVVNTPAHLLPDLLEHFRSVTGGKGGAV